MAFLVPILEEIGLGTVEAGMAHFRVVGSMNAWWWAGGAAAVATGGAVGTAVGVSQANLHKHDKVTARHLMPTGFETVYGAAPSAVPYAADPRSPYTGLTSGELSDLLINGTSTRLTITRSGLNSTAGIFLPFPPEIRNLPEMVQHYLRECGGWDCDRIMPQGVVPEFITDNNDTNTDANVMIHKLPKIETTSSKIFRRSIIHNGTLNTKHHHPHNHTRQSIGVTFFHDSISHNSTLNTKHRHSHNHTHLSPRAEGNRPRYNMTTYESDFLNAWITAASRGQLDHLIRQNHTSPTNLSQTNLTASFLTHTYINFLQNLASNHTLLHGGLLGPKCALAPSSPSQFHTRAATLTRSCPDGRMISIEGRFVSVNEEKITEENRAKFSKYLAKFARGEELGREGSEFMFGKVMGFEHAAVANMGGDGKSKL